MKSRAWSLSIVFLLVPLLSGFVTAAESSSEQPHVTLTLREFEDLFSTAKLTESERSLSDRRQHLEQEHQRKVAELEEYKRQQQKQAEQRKSQNNQELFPQNFQVLTHTAHGIYNASISTGGDTEGTAIFDMKMTVRIMERFEQKWTVVPLVSNATVVSDFRIEQFQDDKSFAMVDHVASSDVMVVRRGPGQAPSLMTYRAGLFRISYQVFSRVSKNRNSIHQRAMSQFLYPLSDFSLSVQRSGIVRDFSVQPVEAIWRVERHSANTSSATPTNSTDISITLPLTADRIELRWLDVREDSYIDTKTQDVSSTTQKEGTKKPKDEQDEAPQVTVVHEVMHSVGEGMVRSSHILEFTTSSREFTAPAMFVLKGPNVRITSIEGHALQSWETIKTMARAENEQLIRISWKRSHLESTATLLVHTETDRIISMSTQPEAMIDDVKAAMTTLIQLPHIECQSVLRQVGHVGVTKESNIEVHQHATTGGMLRCDAMELSSQLRLNMDRPIVLSYKYLNPANASITLSVEEHMAMDTLEATIDRFHYKAVMTETHIMHSVLLNMQSTKLQYLELFALPADASMFTLLVNSVPAKPVVGSGSSTSKTTGHSSIRVPLLVGLDPEAANAGESLRTSVELSYISTHDSPLFSPSVKNGTLTDLAPPHVTLPISVLTAQLRLPSQYDYKFEEKDLTLDKKGLAFPLPESYSYQTGKRVVEKDYQFSFKDDVWPDDDIEEKPPLKLLRPMWASPFSFIVFWSWVLLCSCRRLTSCTKSPNLPANLGFLSCGKNKRGNGSTK